MQNSVILIIRPLLLVILTFSLHLPGNSKDTLSTSQVDHEISSSDIPFSVYLEGDSVKSKWIIPSSLDKLINAEHFSKNVHWFRFPLNNTLSINDTIYLEGKWFYD